MKIDRVYLTASQLAGRELTLLYARSKAGEGVAEEIARLEALYLRILRKVIVTD